MPRTSSRSTNSKRKAEDLANAPIAEKSKSKKTKTRNSKAKAKPSAPKAKDTEQRLSVSPVPSDLLNGFSNANFMPMLWTPVPHASEALPMQLPYVDPSHSQPVEPFFVELPLEITAAAAKTAADEAAAAKTAADEAAAAARKVPVTIEEEDSDDDEDDGLEVQDPTGNLVGASKKSQKFEEGTAHMFTALKLARVAEANTAAWVEHKDTYIGKFGGIVTKTVDGEVYTYEFGHSRMSEDGKSLNGFNLGHMFNPKDRSQLPPNDPNAVVENADLKFAMECLGRMYAEFLNADGTVNAAEGWSIEWGRHAVAAHRQAMTALRQKTNPKTPKAKASPEVQAITKNLTDDPALVAAFTVWLKQKQQQDAKDKAAAAKTAAAAMDTNETETNA